MLAVYVHSHALKHGLSEDEIRHAWNNYVKSQHRKSPREDQIIRIGYGKTTPKAVQMIGIAGPEGILIIHAMTPPQKEILKELGMPRRKR